MTKLILQIGFPSYHIPSRRKSALIQTLFGKFDNSEIMQGKFTKCLSHMLENNFLFWIFIAFVLVVDSSGFSQNLFHHFIQRYVVHRFIFQFYFNKITRSFIIKPFLVNVPTLYPLKTPENQVYKRGYKMGNFTRNGSKFSIRILSQQENSQFFQYFLVNKFCESRVIVEWLQKIEWIGGLLTLKWTE